ncbi:MAG: class I SAM-dependent DNA methyltransferase [Bacteroidia bacterium]
MIIEPIINTIIESPENEYIKQVRQAHRKKFAQFFTPYPIAVFMAKWILSNPSCQSILDPALGLGIFFRAVLANTDKEIALKGYDIDDEILVKTAAIFKENINIEIINKDYMFNDWNNRYDGVICNPPYLKFHDYDEKEAILAEFQSRLGLILNGFTNLYTLFLLKSIHQLTENGRCAYLIPSEFLNSDYGVNVKKYLVENRLLRYVIVFDFKENVFTDALTTASIFLFANDNAKKEVEFITIQSLNDLERLIEKIVSYPKLSLEKTIKINYEMLNPEIKWRSYYQEQNAKRYKHLIPFSMYARVVRGIATGDNDYFSFNVEKQQAFEIPDKYLLPCIMKATDAEGHFFTKEDFINLKKNNKKVLLLNAFDIKDEKVKGYLALGEKTGVNQRFLTSKRTPWYALENRVVAPIWVGVFNRKGLRFIRNEANIKNLTTFHCVYLNTMFLDNTDLFFAYLLTDVAKEILNDNKREYGNGLNKFEPNDLNKAEIVDLSILTEAQKKEIITLYNAYRISITEKRTETDLLKELNEVFKTIYLK